jgi:hypothetical protein
MTEIGLFEEFYRENDILNQLAVLLNTISVYINCLIAPINLGLVWILE